jgi:hypothetical protein
METSITTAHTALDAYTVGYCIAKVEEKYFLLCASNRHRVLQFITFLNVAFIPPELVKPATNLHTTFHRCTVKSRWQACKVFLDCQVKESLSSVKS